MWSRISVATLVLALGCGPAIALDSESGDGGNATGTSTSSSSLPGDSTVGDATATTTATGPSTTVATSPMDGDGSSEDDGSFLTPVDTGRVEWCDTFGQDCPEGYKCMPYASSGGASWNGTRCVPIADDPAQVGDACSVEASAASGLDNCVLGAMCFYVDPETLEGTCIPLCTGSPENPMCPEEYHCAISGDGALTPCLPNCDPIEQDCTEGHACYPLNDTFTCAADASGDAGMPGDTCQFINACDPATACLPSELISDCAGSSCCVPLCDLSDPNASATCAAFDPITTCTPWYAEDEAPTGYENVGLCGAP